VIQRLRWTSKSVFLSVELVDYFQMTKTDEDYLTKFDLLFHGKFALTVEGVQVESDVGEGADAHLEAAGEGLRGASLAGSESVANGSLQLMGVPVGHAY